jgi:hypothetical protein
MHWFKTPNLPDFDPARTLLFAGNLRDLELLATEDPSAWNVRQVGYACNSFAVFCRAAGYEPRTPRDVVEAAIGLVLGEIEADR